MRLQFLGATATVTGSKTLVTAGASRVLVDCGLFQGYKALRLRNWAPPPFDPASLDAVVLTHAHIDHSGYLPLLAKRGFRGRIYCTEGTYELCRILLPDSAHLQEEQAEHANRYGYSKHSPALPLYTREDAELALTRFAPVSYERPWEAAPGIDAHLSPAGHILGASIASLAAEGKTCVFSGDLGRSDDPIMRPPSHVERADALVLESTYGDRLHARDDPAELLGQIVSRTAARGGVVVVPAFAVGRAQALLLHLFRLKAAGAIPASLPIYLDSPMASDVTALYVRCEREHRLTPRDCEAMARVAKNVRTPWESAQLDQSSWPMVIVAGSGMATGGRVLHHLKRFAPDERNAIVFAGFQAGGTRGADMVNGAAEVKIHGEFVPVRAQVHNLEGLSAHADYAEILDWLGHLKRPPARIFLTHGEPAAAEALRMHIARRLRWSSEVPDYLETADLGVASAPAGVAAAKTVALDIPD
ncbi:MAG: MBL fold metallo-hydrolase RNA specificity domain-containing protein [Usitatibacter sp.]